jgi:leucyl aminopeptidase
MQHPVELTAARISPSDVDAVGVPVATRGPVARELGLGRAALETNGFEGKVGQTLVLPVDEGVTRVAVGIGTADDLSAKDLRLAAAALVRAVGKRASVATSLAGLQGVDSATAGRAVVEGALLAAHRHAGSKSEPPTRTLDRLVLTAPQARLAGLRRGIRVGAATAAAAIRARDLANTPPAQLTARRLAERAGEWAAEAGIEVEVFNRDQLAAMGCGGIVGVNAGSVEPPRMIRLVHTPEGWQGGDPHLVLVGKGVMYDSGGLSLKPTDGMHVLMKMDMSGAAAVLSAVLALPAVGSEAKVTGLLMCTDNMPSGSALKLGDVLRFRNGKTAEIHNTDAEGRLVLADGLSLAAEAEPDAIVDIATLTGACLGALGPRIAGLFSTDTALSERVRAASAATDEPVWQLPLERGYRKLLDSQVADMRNVGGPYGGAITAALFLSEFVGTVPWAHLDIAGPMNSDADDGWLAKGATGFGTRLLIELASTFTR